MRRRFLLLVLLLLLAIPARAKGPADRIIVTGPTIDGEVILDYPETNYPLSFALLEDFSAGPVDAPASPGDLFYELERQFLVDEAVYRTFDRSRFYPQSGYVFYIGIENGWSDYDQKWFHAQPEASEVFATWFDSSAHPALVLMHEGEILLVDPSSLVALTRLDISDQLGQVQGFVDAPDATTFDVTGVQLDGATSDYRVDLANQEVCPIQTKRTPAGEAVGIPWIVADVVSRQNRAAGGADFVSVDAFSQGRALLYQPGATMTANDASGGIVVVSLASGKQLDHWLPDHRFSQVIAGGDHLYALEAAADTTLLLQLRASDGFILNTSTLPRAGWSLGYGLFDLSGLDQPALDLHLCS